MLNSKLFAMVLMLVAICLPLAANDEPEDKTEENRIEGKGEDKTPDSASEEKTAKIVEQLTGRFAEMATTVKVNEKQAKLLLAIQTAMDKALAKWDKASEKKIAAAEAKIEKTKNAKRKARLELELRHFKSGRDRLEAGFQRRAVSVLKPDQRGEYFGPKLWSAISQEFAAVGLDEAQEAKALKICKGLARTAGSDPTTNRTLKDRAYRMVASNVLTKEQKKLLPRRRTTAKTVSDGNERTRDN